MDHGDIRVEKRLRRIPVQRKGKPRDNVPDAALASTAAIHITGWDFAIDGGTLAFGD